MLFIILALEIYTYIDSLDEDEKKEGEKILFHLCHDWETLICNSFWWLSNVLLMFIGWRISRAILNSNLHLMTLEQDSFYAQGTIVVEVCQMRQKQSSRMMCVLYMMIGVSTWTLLNCIYRYYLFSEDCNPVYMTREFNSFVKFIELFVTRQLWIYLVTQFLWPTKKQEKEDEMLDINIDRMDQNLDFET